MLADGCELPKTMLARGCFYSGDLANTLEHSAEALENFMVALDESTSPKSGMCLSLQPGVFFFVGVYFLCLDIHP